MHHTSTTPAILALLPFVLAAMVASAALAEAPSAVAPVATPQPVASVAAAAETVEDGRAWLVVTHQRGDVFELSTEELRRLLRGETTNWAQLGGTAAGLRLYLPDEGVATIAASLDLERAELAGEVLPWAEVLARVEAEPGALGFTTGEHLRVGLRALILDGHDPYRDPAADSPLRPPTVRDPFDPTLLLATGELIPARCSNYALDLLDDYGAMFEGVRAILGHADLVLGQLEVPLSSLGAATPCVETFVLQGDPRAVPAIAAAGFDLLALVGNHIKDCWDDCSGDEALRETLSLLDAAGVRTVGAAEDETMATAAVEVRQDGRTFAFLAFDMVAPWNGATEQTPGVAVYDATHSAEAVARAAASADSVVVSINWGVEYTSTPSASQRAAARVLVEAGADLVIGNHPHVVQAVEYLDGALVAYALGNLVFDQSWSVETTEGVLLEASFAGGSLIGYRLLPLVITGVEETAAALYRPGLVGPPHSERILGRLWTATDALPPR